MVKIDTKAQNRSVMGKMERGQTRHLRGVRMDKKNGKRVGIKMN